MPKHVIIADANCKYSTVKFLSEICHRRIEESCFYKNETIRNIRKIFFLNGKAGSGTKSNRKTSSG